MQQAIALAVIIGIASGLAGAWLLQREDDRRAVLSLNGRRRRSYVPIPISYPPARSRRSTTRTPR
jgi:hypothetical protein